MSSKNGFSLVELSIVLVILGLLVGGVLGGQSLIRAAELRSINTQLDELKIALNAFKSRYRAIPGDMRNAGKFWGYAETTGPNGGCLLGTMAVGTGTQTCDGNGDNIVLGYSGNTAISGETMRFWQHLGNAGLLTGTYKGVLDIAQGPMSPGVHVPAGKISGTHWHSWGSKTLSAGSYANPIRHFSRPAGNYLFLGAPLATGNPLLDTISGGVPTGPFLSSPEMWNLDSKFDDGKPASGLIHAVDTGGCTNATSDDPNAEYALENDNTTCSMVFLNIY